MGFKINEDCIVCMACIGVCPVGAIEEGAGEVKINPDICIDCGICVGVCPVNAIVEDATKKSTGGGHVCGGCGGCPMKKAQKKEGDK